MNEYQLSVQIPMDHPSFGGHFPGRPIVPGVVLLDEVVQAATRLVPGWDSAAQAGLDVPVCKFLQPVLPGATLGLTLSPGIRPGMLNFRLQQAGQTVASGSLRLANAA
jgi:3-hydroxymyristoyl/3-hydroxydecanoyl-(acyl carrier protein) dehydratase